MSRETPTPPGPSSRGRTRVSVVVPAFDEAAGIAEALAAIGAQEPPAREVLVVDGGSGDGTPEVARRAGARVLTARRGRGIQLHTGARAAGGDILLFLHADTRLPRGAMAAVEAALGDPAVVGGKFRLRFEHRHPVLGAVAFGSRLPWAWASYGDAATFVRRDVYERMGGFEDVPLFEDHRFFARLRREGRIRVLPLEVTTSCRRFCRRGPLRQLLENAALLAGHALGASPRRLADRYRESGPKA